MLLLSKKVCHITTLHPRFDVRIFHKECISLSKLLNVTLLVADGKGDQESAGVNILDCGKRYDNKFLRFFFTSYKLYSHAKKLDCGIYHFHDSDFILFAWLLILKGKKVIYDSHEDLPRQILGKEYISSLFRPLISRVAELTENLFSKKFSAIITPTPAISNRFSRLNRKVQIVSNFPPKYEFNQINYSLKPNRICYLGGISGVRGIHELLDAMSIIHHDFTLEIAGMPETPDILKKINDHSKVNFMGFVEREKIKEILRSSRIGIVTLYPSPNHIESYPVKMFEYMAAGIPVVASDFPLWKDIITKHECGICVDPRDPQKIAEAISYLLENPSEACRMGINGRNIINQKYNWESESEKLINLYSELLV